MVSEPAGRERARQQGRERRQSDGVRHEEHMSLRWEDERYVRFYVRDTTDWLMLSWKAQGLFGLILRKVDRAGVLDLGKLGKRGIVAHIGGPSAWSEIEPLLD